jgi:hypothetical protein
MFNKNIWSNTAYFLLSLALLIIQALDNGYALVYSDSGAYIASGWDSHVPVDRPIMYAFFVRHISMAFSLWFVITMQAIIVTTLVLFTFKYFIKAANYFLCTFLTIAVLVAGTAVSYYTSQIMPDIFSGVVIICLGLLLTIEDLSKPVKIILAILVVFSNMAHSSNLLTSTLIIGFIILLTLIFKQIFQIPIKRICFVLLLIASSWLITPLLNYSLGAGFKVSRAPNIFIMGRLVESGILNQYLHDNCAPNSNPLCAYMDHLPEKAWHFLWYHESPLYAGGCRDAAGHHSDCWLIKNEEYRPLIKEIFTTPKYLKMYVAYAFRETMMQLVDFRNEGLAPMMEGSPVMGNIAWRFKKEYHQYINSKQSKAPYKAEINSIIQNVVISCCILFLGICFFVKRMRDRIPLQVRIFSLIVFLGIFFNAAICATFSMVASRFQGRVIWLLLLVSILFTIYQFRKKTKEII